MNADFVGNELMTDLPEGREAIWNNLPEEGDVIIEASAGTGKTYTLERVVLKLVSRYGADFIRNILIVTFTEKAAGELRDRIRLILSKAGLLSAAFDDAEICTIHSFCRDVLSEYAFESRLPMQAWQIAHDGAIVREAVHTVFSNREYTDGLGCRGLAENGNFGKFVKSVSDCAAAMLSGSGKIPKTGEDALVLAQSAEREARKIKEQLGQISFDDMIVKAEEIVKKAFEGENSPLLALLRRRYRVALVDEFQDTDQRQWSIFSKLFSFGNNILCEPGAVKNGFLLVVGDPKQAIYSFRGADVGAYLGAKKELLESGAKLFTLSRTYRSRPELVEIFNVFFGREWFDMPQGGEGISYEKVEYPAENGKFAGFEDLTGCKALSLLESLPEEQPVPEYWKTGYGKRDICIPVFGGSVAAEIKRLVSLDAAYLAGNGEPCRYRYRDMCILVRTKDEAARMADILAKHGVPYGKYRDGTLLAGREAEMLLALFDFLASPSSEGRLSALLLTELFGIHPCRLGDVLASLPQDISATIDKWQDCARRRDWGRLFESVMSDTLLSCPLPGDSGYDRRYCACRQILDDLLLGSVPKQSTAHSYASMLREMLNGDTLAEEGAVRKRESDADRVQIMTMHASKGLEFKVVFLACGYAAEKTTSGNKEHEAREERRLYYVAVTRASHKLYLPWSRWARHVRRPKKNSAEEVPETGIGSVGSALLDYREGGFLAKAIVRSLEAGLASDLCTHPIRGEGGASAPSGGRQDVAVYDIGNLSGLRLAWDSFSSLSGRAAANAEPDAAAGRDEESTLAREHENLRERLDARLVRPGAESGTVFHEIMEELCNGDDLSSPGFATGNLAWEEAVSEKSGLLAVVRRAMARSSMQGLCDISGESTETVLCRMAWNALRTPITIGGASFRLKDVPRDCRMAETEFVIDARELFGARLPPDCTGEGVLDGKMDLLVSPFGREGKSYIIDWKTNLLPDYGKEAVAESMAHSGYHLQHRLYSHAVKYWLGEERLGGVAYLYVRAGALTTDFREGVYAASPSDTDFSAVDAMLLEALAQSRTGARQ